jgi:prepilin-type N-terminal cleavage/methylation domain-containing protein
MSKKSKNAFTMIEMMVVVAIISVISILLITILSNSSKTFRVGSKRINYSDSAMKAQRDFERYARGAVEVLEAESDLFSFMSYLRADTRPAPTKISYYLENGDLFRSLIAPEASGNDYIYPEENKEATLVASDLVGSNIFQYFDEANQTIPLPAAINQIKAVKFRIAIDDDPANPPDNISVETIIQFRNLKTNL